MGEKEEGIEALLWRIEELEQRVQAMENLLNVPVYYQDALDVMKKDPEKAAEWGPEVCPWCEVFGVFAFITRRMQHDDDGKCY